MLVFEMVVLIVFIVTVGKVVQSFASRPAGSDPALGREQLKALESELRANDVRLAQTEEKVAQLNEKLEFMENLLARPERTPRLPDSASGPQP